MMFFCVGNSFLLISVCMLECVYVFFIFDLNLNIYVIFMLLLLIFKKIIILKCFLMKKYNEIILKNF